MLRRRRGQSIIETVVGIIFMIPLILCLFDIAVMVMAQTANDNMAKNAARAAASAVGPTGVGTLAAADVAANRVIADFPTSDIIRTKRRTEFNYNQVRGEVTVGTEINVQLPVPFPGFSQVRFRARAIEPIVALPPSATP